MVEFRGTSPGIGNQCEMVTWHIKMATGTGGSVFQARPRASSKLSTVYDAEGNEIEVNKCRATMIKSWNNQISFVQQLSTNCTVSHSCFQPFESWAKLRIVSAKFQISLSQTIDIETDERTLCDDKQTKCVSFREAVCHSFWCGVPFCRWKLEKMKSKTSSSTRRSSCYWRLGISERGSRDCHPLTRWRTMHSFDLCWFLTSKTTSMDVALIWGDSRWHFINIILSPSTCTN